MELKQQGPTTLRKGRDGWKAETTFKDEITGEAVELNTWKGSRGGIYSCYQFGKLSADGCFSFMMFGDERGTLCEDRTVRCTDKTVQAMHTTALQLFIDKFKDKMAPVQEELAEVN
jgi:hypothetical protein